MHLGSQHVSESNSGAAGSLSVRNGISFASRFYVCGDQMFLHVCFISKYGLSQISPFMRYSLL